MKQQEFLNLQKGDVLKKKTTGEILTVDSFYLEGYQFKKFVVCAVAPRKGFFIRENTMYQFDKVS